VPSNAARNLIVVVILLSKLESEGSVAGQLGHLASASGETGGYDAVAIGLVNFAEDGGSHLGKIRGTMNPTSTVEVVAAVKNTQSDQDLNIMTYYFAVIGHVATTPGRYEKRQWTSTWATKPAETQVKASTACKIHGVSAKSTAAHDTDWVSEPGEEERETKQRAVPCLLSINIHVTANIAPGFHRNADDYDHEGTMSKVVTRPGIDAVMIEDCPKSLAVTACSRSTSL